MNTKTRSRFFFLLNTGLVLMLLGGCAAPAVKPVEVKAEAWDRFEAELESLRQEMKFPGMSAAYDFYQLKFVPEAADDQTYYLVLTMYGMSFTGRKKLE